MVNDLKEVVAAFKEMERMWKKGSNSTSDLELAGKSFFESMTYRLPGGAERDPLIGFRTLIRTWRSLKSPRKDVEVVIPIDQNSTSAIVGEMSSNIENNTIYVSRSSAEKLNCYILKDQLPAASNVSSAFQWTWFVFAITLAFKALFSAQRVSIALSIKVIPEIASLVEITRNRGLKRIYDFSPYQIDGNLMAYILMRNGLDVVRIPSPGPLSSHNTILLGNRVVFSSQYHFEEYELLKSTIRTQSKLRWVPERSFSYLEIYRDHPSTKTKTIGYYSHGEWLRRAQGHADPGLNIMQAEMDSLKALGAFIKEHSEFRITVFPHPRERNPENIVKATEFYQSFFGENGFEMAPPNIPTAHTFHTVDIAIIAFSTIIYERLLCGYKVLIGNSGIKNFPIKTSPLNTICFTTNVELEHLILRNSVLSDDEFFKQNALSDYRLTKHPELLREVYGTA